MVCTLYVQKKNKNNLCPMFTRLYLSIKFTYTAINKEDNEFRVEKDPLKK